jgi:hypothetical protein
MCGNRRNFFAATKSIISASRDQIARGHEAL